ncbi:MAG: fibrobacter succinogenes major paralogous domain-containing protein [Bacteroidota bacterium]
MKTLVNSIIIAAALMLSLSASAQQTSTLTDSRDGKTYKTVTIGKQIWMAENLAYKATADCWAYEENEKNVPLYGYLYTYEASLKVCPTGWHLPTDKEWTLMSDFLGGQDNAGIKLKLPEAWKGAQDTATNSSGFTALPGGFRYVGGAYQRIGLKGFWWTATESEGNTAWYRSMFNTNNTLNRYDDMTEYGLSVRCVKD